MSNESKLDTSAIETLVKNIVAGLQKVVADTATPADLKRENLPRIDDGDTDRLGGQIAGELDKAREMHRTLIDKRRSELGTSLESRRKRLVAAAKPSAPAVPKKTDGFVVTGRIVDDKEGIGLPNVAVRAFDLDRKYDDQLGETRTDKDGYYRIEYSAETFKDVFDQQPETYIEVMDANGESLYTSPRSFVHKAGAVEKIDAEVDGGQLKSSLALAKQRSQDLELKRREVELLKASLPSRDLRVPLRGATDPAED